MCFWELVKNISHYFQLVAASSFLRIIFSVWLSCMDNRSQTCLLIFYTWSSLLLEIKITCVGFSWWAKTTWRLPQHGGFVASLSLVSTASAFHSCGRQYRKVWKVAIETASTGEMRGSLSSTQWRSWFGKSCTWFHNASLQSEDLTSWSNI